MSLLGGKWSCLETNSPDLPNVPSIWDFTVWSEKQQRVFILSIILGHGWSCGRMWLVRDVVSFRVPPFWHQDFHQDRRAWHGKGEFLFLATGRNNADPCLWQRACCPPSLHISTSAESKIRKPSPRLCNWQKWKPVTTGWLSGKE